MLTRGPATRAGREQLPQRREHLAIGGVVVDRGDSARQIGLQALAPIPGKSGDGGGGEVRMQIEQPRHQRLPRGVDHASSRRDGGIVRRSFNLRAADHHRHQARRRSRAIHHARAANRNRRRLRPQANAKEEYAKQTLHVRMLSRGEIAGLSASSSKPRS